MSKASEMKWEAKYRKLDRIHTAQVTASQRLEVSNQKLLERNSFLEAQLKNAQQNVDITKNIMRQQLTDSNAREQDLIKEIGELKSMVRQLRE